MSTSILIYGESGTGKSTSIRNMNHENTFIIASISKPLPFRGWKTKYIPFSKTEGGNYLVSDNCNKIIETMLFISDKRPEIKNIIIDDFQYIMSNQYMRRAHEKGYEKFTDIGESTWRVITQSSELRSDLKIYFLSHSDTQEGKTRIKTIGKMLDEKICVEGMFTIVLNSIVADGNYMFVTQNNGHSIAKSPIGMFETAIIDNDLSTISDTIDKYDMEDEAEVVESYLRKIQNSKTIDELREYTRTAINSARLQSFSQKVLDDIKNEGMSLSKKFEAKKQKTNQPTEETKNV